MKITFEINKFGAAEMEYSDKNGKMCLLVSCITAGDDSYMWNEYQAMSPSGNVNVKIASYDYDKLGNKILIKMARIAMDHFEAELQERRDAIEAAKVLEALEAPISE